MTVIYAILQKLYRHMSHLLSGDIYGRQIGLDVFRLLYIVYGDDRDLIAKLLFFPGQCFQNADGGNVIGAEDSREVGRFLLFAQKQLGKSPDCLLLCLAGLLYAVIYKREPFVDQSIAVADISAFIGAVPDVGYFSVPKRNQVFHRGLGGLSSVTDHLVNKKIHRVSPDPHKIRLLLSNLGKQLFRASAQKDDAVAVLGMMRNRFFSKNDLIDSRLL